MASADRDIQLSEFRASTCTILVSSGAGSEGRNFQFCDRVVHADLPDDPLVLEQRIGRVDRLGRTEDVGVVYFTGSENRLAEAYASLGLFEEVSDGTSPALEPVRVALRGGVRGDALAPLIAEYRAAVNAEESSRPIFPDTYDPEDAEATMAEIPSDAEEVVESFVLGAALRTGVDMLEKPGTARFYMEYGANALVDAIPGVTHGSRFLGTFSRTEAMVASEIDFYASGHPLIEGLIWELDDSEAGRVGALRSETLAEPSLFVATRKSERHAPELIRIGPGGSVEPYQWKELLDIVRDARPSRRSRMVAPDDEALATPLFVLAIRPE
jgi:ATP-dependent helicase HepA